jgi:hypothetical protein
MARKSTHSSRLEAETRRIHGLVKRAAVPEGFKSFALLLKESDILLTKHSFKAI